MQDYTIAEHYTLPSLGKVYKTEINPEITLRSMTTNEEMKRLATVDMPYKNMSEIIDACLVEGPDISSYDMCVGDYQFLLHKLRIVTYGPDYPIINTCPYCGSQLKDVVNLEDLEVLQYTDDLKECLEFDLPRSKKHIKLKVQTPRMLDRITDRIKDFKKKAKGQNLPDPTLVYTLAELIDEIDGERPEPVKLETWLRGLPMMDTNVILQYADKLNNSIGISTLLDCDCDVCGLPFKTGMKTTAEFFRPVLNIGR